MPRVLIVGGSARLGSYVIPALRRELDEPAITVMDLRPYAGPHAQDVEFMRGDLTRPGDCARVLGAARFDVVISMVTPDLHAATVEDYMAINADGVRSLVAAARQHEVRAFVYVSSIAVTDHFRDHVEVDERHPLPPIADYRSPYDRSKRLGEDAVLAADAPGGLRSCALRLGGVLSDMGDLALRYLLGPVVMLQGHGRPIDMIYAGNAAHGIALAARALLEQPESVGGEAMFLTKGRSMSTHELYCLVGDMLGRRVYVMPPLAADALLRGLEARHRVQLALGRRVPGIALHDFMRIQSYTQTFDNSKIRERIGYVPLCTIDEGLRRIVDAHLGASAG